MSIFLALLPFLLKVVGFFLDKFGASEATKKAMIDLISAAKDDGLISIQNADRLTAHRKEVQDQIDKDKAQT